MKWVIVCRVCRKEKRVYCSAAVNVEICEVCLPANDNPELARLVRDEALRREMSKKPAA